MKKLLPLLSPAFILGCYDSNDYQECYEAFFLNETAVDVSLFYNKDLNDINHLDSISLKAGDTTNTMDNNDFPILHKDGLGWAEHFYIRLKFNSTPEKCLTFKGSEYQNYDIRDFSSYENLGQCKYCSMRGQSAPDIMLYRITEEMFKQAEPCE